jgi:hypothetical protein
MECPQTYYFGYHKTPFSEASAAWIADFSMKADILKYSDNFTKDEIVQWREDCHSAVNKILGEFDKRIALMNEHPGVPFDVYHTYVYVEQKDVDRYIDLAEKINSILMSTCKMSNEIVDHLISTAENAKQYDSKKESPFDIDSSITSGEILYAKCQDLIERIGYIQMLVTGSVFSASQLLGELEKVTDELKSVAIYFPLITSMIKVCGTIEPPQGVIANLQRVAIRKSDVDANLAGLIVSRNIILIKKMMLETVLTK